MSQVLTGDGVTLGEGDGGAVLHVSLADPSLAPLELSVSIGSSRVVAAPMTLSFSETDPSTPRALHLSVPADSAYLGDAVVDISLLDSAGNTVRFMPPSGQFLGAGLGTAVLTVSVLEAEPATGGCTDSLAQNYDITAAIDSGGCLYECDALKTRLGLLRAELVPQCVVVSRMTPDVSVLAATHQIVQGVPYRFLQPGMAWPERAGLLPPVHVAAGDASELLAMRYVSVQPTSSAGIRLHDAVLKLEVVTFVGHSAPRRTAIATGLAQGRGGALSLSDTEGYIIDVLFKANTASMGGGAIYARGGHSVIKVPSLT